MLPRRVQYYGIDQPLPEQLPLRAGPLSLIYENGDLRYVRLGEREIIRRIYAAVRGPNWETTPNALSAVEMHIDPDAFHIRYEVDNRLGDIHFRWRGEISGENDGTLTFSFDGEALSTFRRNRIGFCVLHPIKECAGAACRVEHADGMTEESTFPALIAPQLIKDGRPRPVGVFHSLRAMTHQVLPDMWAELRFEGDLFELEDQRNWIDASFKTYCTPLELPFPVEISQGTRISQKLRLRLYGTLPALAGSSVTARPIEIMFIPDAPAQRLPGLGLSVAGHGQPLSTRESERLRALHLAYLRAELRLAQTGWEQALARATEEAAAIGVPLELVLVLSDDDEDELAAVVDALSRHRAPVSAFLLWHEREMVVSDARIALARRMLARYDPTIPIGAGSKANFAELNRAWPAVDLIDFVSVAANPQVHAMDVASIAETGAAFVPLIGTTRRVMNRLPLAISALTLKPQFNAVATGPVSGPPPGELPPQVDLRQMSLFGAGWLLSSLKYISETGGVRYVSCFETTGWLGVMSTGSGSSLPDKFPALPGCVFPMYHTLAALGEMREATVIPVRSSAPLRVDALLLYRGQHSRLLVVNLTSADQTVRLPPLEGKLTGGMLDENTFTNAVQMPERFRSSSAVDLNDARHLTLRPFALACLDVRREVTAGEQHP